MVNRLRWLHVARDHALPCFGVSVPLALHGGQPVLVQRVAHVGQLVVHVVQCVGIVEFIHFPVGDTLSYSAEFAPSMLPTFVHRATAAKMT